MMASLQASADTVVVASDDPAFRAAIADAMASAGLAIIVRDNVVPPSVSALTDASRSLADSEHARATVWLVAGTSPTLVAYDRTVDRVLVRALPFAMPLGTAEAAEAARTARTMLNALRVAVDDATPHVDRPPPPPPIVPRAPPVLAVGLGLGSRVRSAGADLAVEGSLTAIWRPRALGIAAIGSFAPAADVTAMGFAGHVRDSSAALVVRAPWAISIFELDALAGAALHVVQMRGALVDGPAPATARVDPAVRVGVGAMTRLGHEIDAGVWIWADYLVSRQRYDVDGAEVLAVPRFQLSATVQVSIGIL